MKNLSNEEIKDLMTHTGMETPTSKGTNEVSSISVPTATEAAPNLSPVAEVISATSSADLSQSLIRKTILIGCGDGGCNIITAARKAIDSDENIFTIAYNTSSRAMDSVSAHIKLVQDGADGAGKVRDFSKDIFKGDAYKKMLTAVQDGLQAMPDAQYIVICSTADGGTGSGTSPLVANLLKSYVTIPIIMVGVYPNGEEDATAQYNAIVWQSEIDKVGVPYLVFDNNSVSGTKTVVHTAVNNAVAAVCKLIVGEMYGNTNISMIDNRNLFMLLGNIGGRIIMTSSAARISSNMSLDQHVEGMLTNSHQLAPNNVRGLGVFVRAPRETLDRLDTNLSDIKAKYGAAVLTFAHLEVGDDTSVSIVLTGCTTPSDRLATMKGIYDDVMASQVITESATAKSMAGAMSNPLSVGANSAIISNIPTSGDIDMSLLDL